ncbi:hypothetical protein AB5N19_01670 [Seiridium cardinale]
MRFRIGNALLLLSILQLSRIMSVPEPHQRTSCTFSAASDSSESLPVVLEDPNVDSNSPAGDDGFIGTAHIHEAKRITSEYHHRKIGERATQEIVFWRTYAVKPAVDASGGPEPFPISYCHTEGPESGHATQGSDDQSSSFLGSEDPIAGVEGFSVQCDICGEQFADCEKSFVHLPCQHSFCPDCLKKWLQRSSSNKKCPFCRGATLQHCCGHVLGEQIKAGNKITTEMMNSPCYDVCPGTFGIQHIDDWLDGQEPPEQVVLWLMGEVRLPSELVEWARERTPYNRLEPLLVEGHQPKEDRFLHWFVDEVMAAASNPIWPLWLVSEDGTRIFGLVRRQPDYRLGFRRILEVTRQQQQQRYGGWTGLEWGQPVAEVESVKPDEAGRSHGEAVARASRCLEAEDERRYMIELSEKLYSGSTKRLYKDIAEWRTHLSNCQVKQEFFYANRKAQLEVMIEDVDLAIPSSINPGGAGRPKHDLASELERLIVSRKRCEEETTTAFAKLTAAEGALLRHHYRYQSSRLPALRRRRLDLSMTEKALRLRIRIMHELNKIVRQVADDIGALRGECSSLWPFGLLNMALIGNPAPVADFTQWETSGEINEGPDLSYFGHPEDWEGAMTGGKLEGPE